MTPIFVPHRPVPGEENFWPFVLGPAQAARWQEIYDGRVRANAGRLDSRAAVHLTNERVHSVGAFAEAAFEMLEGVAIRCPVHTGPDLREAAAGPDVGRWQVKGTEVWGGRLLENARLSYKFTPDAPYALVYCRPDSLSGVVAGWRWGHEFLGRPECLVVDGLRDPAYAAPLPLYPYRPPGQR